MKRCILVLTLILLLFMSFQPFQKYVSIAENDIETEINDNIFEELDKLDLSELDDYIKTLKLFDGISVKDKLFKLIKDGNIDFKSLFQTFLSMFFDGIKSLIPVFVGIVSICITCSVLDSLRSSFLDNSTVKIVALIKYFSVLVPVISLSTECYLLSIEAVENMGKQIQILFPIVLTLISVSGGTASSGALNPAVAFLINNLIPIITKIVFPITLTALAFTFVGNISGVIKFDKFVKFFTSFNKWILGLCVTIFTVFFSAQSFICMRYDGISSKVFKYAINSGVPIIGGLLSGSFDLAVAGSLLIKNSLGILGIILMSAVVIKPVAYICCVSLFLRFTASVVEPIGDGKTSDFLSKTANLYVYLTIGILFVAFMYFLMLIFTVLSSELVL